MNDADSTILLVDIGNSRVKWGIAKCNDNRIQIGGPFATHTISSHEALSSLWGAISSPARIMVSNVAGLVIASELTTWTQLHWGLAPQFVYSTPKEYGVINAYIHPEKLGVDRWVALIAAHHAYHGSVCVADCGTAITVDALDAEGKHLGGVIAPGLMVMRRSLAGGTHALPVADGDYQYALANETKAAIASGTLQAAVGLIDRCVRETTSQLGSKPRLLLTGGDALTIAPLLESPVELRPNLILEGLLVIADFTSEF